MLDNSISIYKHKNHNMKFLITFLFVNLFSLSFVSAQDSIPADSIPDLSLFRYSYPEMAKLANANQLPHRIFYNKISSGPDAKWFDAVKRGDLETIRKMVSEGQNIEAKDEASLGQTALGWAAFIGYEDIFDYLIEHGADPHATDRADVYNVFKSAVLGGNLYIVKRAYELLKDEIDINMIESDGENITMVAATNGRLETLKFLLTFHPDLNVVVPEFDASPLSKACERGFTEVVELLIQNGAINHKTGKSNCP